MTSTRSEGPRPDPLPTPSYQGTVTPERVLENALAFWRSVILLSADELGVFAALAVEPRAASTLGRGLGLRHDAVEDFLEALVGLGLIERREKLYHNTREASLYLDSANPAYIGSWLAMARAAMRTMTDLTRQLRTGGTGQPEQPALATQMWADIAEILREGFPQ
ncbi:MAG TPA: methyltransferase dimerization domain-containing protein [Chloroflexota bacterium]